MAPPAVGLAPAPSDAAPPPGSAPYTRRRPGSYAAARQVGPLGVRPTAGRAGRRVRTKQGPSRPVQGSHLPPGHRRTFLRLVTRSVRGRVISSPPLPAFVLAWRGKTMDCRSGVHGVLVLSVAGMLALMSIIVVSADQFAVDHSLTDVSRSHDRSESWPKGDRRSGCVRVWCRSARSQPSSPSRGSPLLWCGALLCAVAAYLARPRRGPARGFRHPSIDSSPAGIPTAGVHPRTHGVGCDLRRFRRPVRRDARSDAKPVGGARGRGSEPGRSRRPPEALLAARGGGARRAPRESCHGRAGTVAARRARRPRDRVPSRRARPRRRTEPRARRGVGGRGFRGAPPPPSPLRRPKAGRADRGAPRSRVARGSLRIPASPVSAG